MAENGSGGRLSPEQLDRMPFKDRLAYFTGREVVDISKGLRHLIHNSDELIEFMAQGIDQGKFPILGMKDGKILIQGGVGKIFTHASILNSIGKKPEDVEFSTSLVNGIRSETDKGFYLEVVTAVKEPAFKGMKVAVGRFSDTEGVPGYKNRENLEKTFGNIKGVILRP